MSRIPHNTRPKHERTIKCSLQKPAQARHSVVVFLPQPTISPPLLILLPVHEYNIQHRPRSAQSRNGSTRLLRLVPKLPVRKHHVVVPTTGSFGDLCYRPSDPIRVFSDPIAYDSYLEALYDFSLSKLFVSDDSEADGQHSFAREQNYDLASIPPIRIGLGHLCATVGT